jgi:hypothetical protein
LAKSRGVEPIPVKRIWFFKAGPLRTILSALLSIISLRHAMDQAIHVDARCIGGLLDTLV